MKRLTLARLPRSRSREAELSLLALAAAVALLASYTVCIARGTPDLVRAMAPAVLAVVGMVAARFVISRAIGAHDSLLLPLVLLLTGIGLALLESVRPQLVMKQIIWFYIGLTSMCGIVLLGDIRRWTDYRTICGVVASVLMLLTSLLGKPLGSQGDVRLAINLGPFNFQASELVRLLIVLFLAGYLADKQDLLSGLYRKWWHISRQDVAYLMPMLVLWLFSLMLLVYQRDLGAALLFFGVFLAMLFVATSRIIYMIIGGGMFAGGAALCYVAFHHVKTRFDIWLNPWSHINSSGYQIAQSLFAIAWGRIVGTGFGQGYSDRVPAVHTDLIFAAAAEQLGLLGTVMLLVCFLLVASRAFQIAIRSRDATGMFIAVGLGTAFALQTFIIVGGVTKLTPLTGITLPFMSYGGSSLVTNCLLVGMLLSLSGRRTPAGIWRHSRELS